MEMTKTNPAYLSHSACALPSARRLRSGGRRVRTTVTGARPRFVPPVPAAAGEHRRHSAAVGCAALLFGGLASIGFGSPVMALSTSGALSPAGPVPGTIFVANAGGAGQGAGGTGPGSITLYRPGATGNARPEAVITKGIDGPGGFTLDTLGDLWVANESGKVVEYSRAELANASPVPTVTLSYGGGGLAFDPSGNLWVANGSDVAELTKAAIARSGSPQPVRAFFDSCSVAFDPYGDLWEGSSSDTVAQLTEAQLATKFALKWDKPLNTMIESLVPKVTITWTSLNGPCKPAFDRSGDLWAGNYNSDTVVEFTKAELAKSGSPAPKVVISSSQNGTPGDVAVDNSGDLWVPTMANSVVEYTKAQLTKSGSPAPALTIAGPATKLNWPWAVTIEP